MVKEAFAGSGKMKTASLFPKAMDKFAP